MSPPAADRSRDRRIEDPSNLWIIHPAARLVLPWFISRRISANAVSVGGLCLGALAALADAGWRHWPFACIGLLLSMAWLVADGLDGLVARATGTASPLGRFLDGICDHGVFLLIYLALAASVGTSEAWILAACAGAVHALQSNFYESERARFHRRCVGAAAAIRAADSNPLVRTYDQVSGLVDGLSLGFDDVLRRSSNPVQLGAAYGAAVVRPLRLMSLLSANVRVVVIFLACMARDPTLFWWFELLPMTAILIIAFHWRHRLESRFIRNMGLASFANSAPTHPKDVTN